MGGCRGRTRKVKKPLVCWTLLCWSLCVTRTRMVPDYYSWYRWTKIGKTWWSLQRLPHGMYLPSWWGERLWWEWRWKRIQRKMAKADKEWKRKAMGE